MLREFTDAKGVKWRVWDVYPISRRLSSPGVDSLQEFNPFPSRDLGEGWLCFESPTEKRRLAPIPMEWERCDFAQLEKYCHNAGYVSRATPPDNDLRI